MQVRIAAVVLRVCPLARFQVGLHHIDEDVLPVHFGAAQWQVGQGMAHTVGGEVINGGIEVFMEAPVAVQMFQRIADHDVFSVFVL